MVSFTQYSLRRPAIYVNLSYCFYFIIAGLPFYDPSKDFTCLDGSRTIPFSSVNDDYCDCADGSDEPGQHSHIFVTLSCNLQNYGTITIIYRCHVFIKLILSSLSFFHHNCYTCKFITAAISSSLSRP